MEKNRASKRFTIIIFILTALTVCFSWVHSLLPASVSSQESQGVLSAVYGIFKFFGAERELAETLIRKLAHFTEFTASGFMLTSCAYCFDRLRPHRYIVRVLFAGLLAALIDETIQLFVEGRAGLITDVWIDFGGVVTGTLIALGVYALYRRLRKI